MFPSAESQIRHGHNAQNKKDAVGSEQGFGEILPPKLPDHLRMIMITVDINDGRLQVAGPIICQDWCLDVLDRAAEEIMSYNKKHSKAIDNTQDSEQS